MPAPGLTKDEGAIQKDSRAANRRVKLPGVLERGLISGRLRPADYHFPSRRLEEGRALVQDLGSGGEQEFAGVPDIRARAPKSLLKVGRHSRAALSLQLPLSIPGWRPGSAVDTYQP